MIHQTIKDIIQPTIEDLGYELWGCEYSSGSRHAVLRIYIDNTNGIGIEDCEKVSRQVGALLDVEDPLPGNYSLEISSPGIPRPLFYPWQYQRYIGQMVQLKLSQPIERQRKYSGVIVSVDEHRVQLQVDEQPLDFLFSNIAKAYLTSK